MEVISDVFTVSLPNYLQSLPLPKTFLGFFSLTGREWLRLTPFFGSMGLVIYLGVHVFRRETYGNKSERINPEIQKECPKVVNTMDIEDLGDKNVYCRCWRSKKFPYCDGSHNKFNENNCDNVGPLIIKKKDA